MYDNHDIVRVDTPAEEQDFMEKTTFYAHAVTRWFADALPTLHRVLAHYDSPRALWNSDHASFERHFAGAHARAGRRLWAVRQTLTIEDIHAELGPALNQGLEMIEQSDPAYPEALRTLPQSPLLLYLRGDTRILHADLLLSIVGTRKPSPYGKQVCADIARALTSLGAVTVSGLALGIDSIAHRSTVEADGATIAVLGSGVDNASIAPRQHLSLAEDIIRSGGLVLSEYPPMIQALPRFFPERNRIIAALGQATIVVEAAERSGSLITARAALEQGRDVYAVPGSIYSEVSIGTNELLAQGALPITAIHGLHGLLDVEADIGTSALRLRDPYLTEHAQHVLDALSAGPQDTEWISKRTGLRIRDVLVALGQLTLAGHIRHSNSGWKRS